VRGGVDTVLPEGVAPQEPRCPAHPNREIALPAIDSFVTARLPEAALDRRMVETAMAEGCDVFLTSDLKILKLGTALRERGLSVHSPQSLLRALEDSGELDPVAHDLAPDLGALSTFYGLRSSSDFDDDGDELPDPVLDSDASES
jgi:hypothetical protein